MICLLNLPGNTKKTASSLRTLGVMFYCIMKKSNGFLQSVLPEEDLAESMKTLIQYCNEILLTEQLHSPRDLCLKLLLIILTGMDQLNQNSIIEHLLSNNLFDQFIRLLNDPDFHNENGHDVVLLITLLVNYRKNEGTNPYVVQLSILADEYALNAFGQIISSKLIEFCRQYTLNLEGHSTSWLSSLSNIVGNMFISDDDTDKTLQIRANNALLLALYENIHLNRNFVTTLAHTQNESSPPSPSNTLQSQNQGQQDLANAAMAEVTPTNLFVSLFEYCSIVMKDYKPESIVNCKLCFLILTCISEDSYANTLMHDENLNFKVTLHRAQMRHRKLPIDKSSKPLSATLFDLIIEFIVSHMMKQKFPIELYLLSVGIIHRLIVYQKRCHVRLNYEWKNLWAALINLLKFLVYQEPYLVKKCNIFALATQVSKETKETKSF